MHRIHRYFSLLALLVCLSGLAGCATSPASDDGARAPERGAANRDADEANDPLEPLNRAIYTFNDKLDRYVMKPVAKGYRAITPKPVRTGVSNFFSNLHEPAVFLNSALQGKFGDAASDLGRFLANTTIGVFGVFDVATKMGLEKHKRDFGQTLGVWGAGEGPYLVLPLFGPSNLRDGVGLIGDYAAYPPTYNEETSTTWKLFAAEIVDTRYRYLEAGDILDQAAGSDPYVFVREAYRQRRRNLIGGDKPAPVDPSIFEEDAPAPAVPKPPAR